MVSLANAITHPRTVVIVNLNASFTLSTVKRTRRSVNMASPTLGTQNFLALYNDNVIKL